MSCKVIIQTNGTYVERTTPKVDSIDVTADKEGGVFVNRSPCKSGYFYLGGRCRRIERSG